MYGYTKMIAIRKIFFWTRNWRYEKYSTVDSTVIWPVSHISKLDIWIKENKMKKTMKKQLSETSYTIKFFDKLAG